MNALDHVRDSLHGGAKSILLALFTTLPHNGVQRQLLGPLDQ